MKHNHWLLGCILLLGMFLFSGCSLLSGESQTGEIDPPQNVSEDELLQEVMSMGVEEENDTEVNLATMEITGYYLDENGYVAPLTFRVPQDQGTARTTLEYMVEDGPGEAFLPQGFRALLPKGTTVETNIVEGGLAVVDFSEPFTSYNVQDERKILEAVTWALTGFDSIDKVQIRVEGETLQEMPRNATPISEPLSRSMGINIERANGVDYGQSTPVTLYFQNQSADGQQYFVPVTRMIPRTDDIPAATIAELIKGPKNDQLHQVIQSDAQVLSVHKLLDDGLVSVNFGDGFLNPDQQASSESIQSVILSLTESTGMAKVEIMVNGVSEIKGTNEEVYAMPVLRPSHVNKVEL